MHTDTASHATCVFLLAGGIGSRMGLPLPKQFTLLCGKPLALYSFDLFTSMTEVVEIVVVCSKEYRHLFRAQSNRKITFAEPGAQRQDSVYNALQAMQTEASIICVHDAARPFITKEMTLAVIASAKQIGAAAAAVKIKYTLKESDSQGKVLRTPPRENLWEVQTPQAIEKGLLAKGFAHAMAKQLNVTDDVSLVEHLNLPVQLVAGSYRNLKITTPEDMHLAEMYLLSMV